MLGMQELQDRRLENAARLRERAKTCPKSEEARLLAEAIAIEDKWLAREEVREAEREAVRGSR